jgi:uncharacterized protein (TIGR02266 family)
MGASEDKRRQRRIPVEIWIDVDADGELYFQRASNLSVGGAYFTQTFPLPVGRKVKLRFSLPGDERPVECQGEIVNAADLGMGVQFVELPEADRTRIEALIDKHHGA